MAAQPTPLTIMTSTRIDFPAGKISRLQDASDLAEQLFPGNRNQQHAFRVLWTTLKWAPGRLVPNLAAAAGRNSISRRTLERVRAKLRRLGLIERVSRFHARFGGREGWMLSTRFERALQQLAERTALLCDRTRGTAEKDRLLVDLADARRAVATRGHTNTGEVIDHEMPE